MQARIYYNQIELHHVLFSAEAMCIPSFLASPARLSEDFSQRRGQYVEKCKSLYILLNNYQSRSINRRN